MIPATLSTSPPLPSSPHTQFNGSKTTQNLYLLKAETIAKPNLFYPFLCLMTTEWDLSSNSFWLFPLSFSFQVKVIYKEIWEVLSSLGNVCVFSGEGEIIYKDQESCLAKIYVGIVKKSTVLRDFKSVINFMKEFCLHELAHGAWNKVSVLIWP